MAAGAFESIRTFATSHTNIQQPMQTDPPPVSKSQADLTLDRWVDQYYQNLRNNQENGGAVHISGRDDGSTGRGILIGMLSAFGSAGFVALIFAAIYFFRYTNRGRIILDRIGRPGEYDDEQALAREEAEALESMDDLQRAEYMRAKAFIQANPPETMQTDISLSQFLAIQEKGVSAWEFEPELEIANCFVEGRTEIEFFDSECSVQSNLPVPKQNEVYYWEAKIYDKPEATLISIGMTTKPYPLFRLPGWHKCSVAYTSNGLRRYNQPFSGTPFGPAYGQGDVVGVGYRPRTGTVFFTRNGKKLEDVAHGLKTQNFFPTVGANGPCTVHVNFGQSGFVFIEANVKKWGLAPQTGSLAPPPPYGSEQGSILLEAGREGVQQGQGAYHQGHGRSRSRYAVMTAGGLTSPGPIRSPTDISLAPLAHIPSHEDIGEGTSRDFNPSNNNPTNHHLPSSSLAAIAHARSHSNSPLPPLPHEIHNNNTLNINGLSLTIDPQSYSGAPPPEYTSPEASEGSDSGRRISGDGPADEEDEDGEGRPMLRRRREEEPARHGGVDADADADRPEVPSYDVATRGDRERERRDQDRDRDRDPGQNQRS